MVSEWIESIKPVAWSGTRQVALVPNGESPLAENMFLLNDTSI